MLLRLLLLFSFFACALNLHAAILGVDEPLKAAPLPDGAIFQTGPDKGLQRLAISPDGKSIALANTSGSVVVCDAASGKTLTTIVAHDQCFCVDFTLDGKSLITGGADKLVKQWDIASGKMIKQFAGHTGEVKFVACSPDGKRVASCEGATDKPSIRVWDIASGNELKAMTGHGDNLESMGVGIDVLSWSPDGRKLLTEASDVTGRLWDAIAGKQIRILPDHDNSVAAVAISPDNSLGASARHPRIDTEVNPFVNPSGPAPSAELRIWKMSAAGDEFELAPPADVPRGITVLRTITGFDGDITCVAFAPDTRTVVAGTTANTIHQWDLETGLEIRRFKLSSQPAHVAVFPDGLSAAALAPREGLMVLKLNDLLPGGKDQSCTSVDDAWNKLNSADYNTRACAFRYFMDNVPQAQIVSEALRRAQPSNEAKTAASEAVAGLDSNNYSVRLNSMEALRQMGAAIRPELIAALKSPSDEVRVRASELLHEIGGVNSPRSILLIEILKIVNSPEARAAIHTLSGPKK
jgi:WD40 repeat protein